MKALDELRDWVRSPIYRIASNSYTFAAERYEQLGAIIDEIETELAERYTPMPVDADGVPIRARDKMCQIRRDGTLADPFEVVDIELVAGELWPVEIRDRYRNSLNPRYLRHYHEPTVEDVLREFANKVCNSGHQWGLDAAETIAEYAAKLCLKEDK